uniref:Histone deacetylase domain-containing protein n=1 Tax=Panagrolaimus sp. JU765 TaxID=591449 RepID=A0AC34QBA9_9BILA
MKKIIELVQKFGHRKVIEQPCIYKGERNCPIPFPTKNVYDEFLKLDHFTDVFKNQLLRRYVNPKMKPQLCVKLINDEGISIHHDDLTGVDTMYKRTINVPINETGYGDAEYAAFMDLFILPIIADYDPELILVSCGFDASFGDREGEMQITPAGYGYMIGSLASLFIPLVLLLEGGYFLEAIPEDAFYTVQALIERKPPALPLGFPSLDSISLTFLDALIERKPPALPLGFPSLDSISLTFLDSLFSIILRNKGRFPTMKKIIELVQKFGHRKVIEQPCIYKGERNCPIPFPTKNVYDEFLKLDHFTDVFKNQLLRQYVNPKMKPQLCVKIINDEGISIHHDDLTLVIVYLTQNNSSRTDEISFFFHCIYLPLTWKYDLDWDTVKLLLKNVKGKEYGSVAVLESDSLVGSILNGSQIQEPLIANGI